MTDADTAVRVHACACTDAVSEQVTEGMIAAAAILPALQNPVVFQNGRKRAATAVPPRQGTLNATKRVR